MSTYECDCCGEENDLFDDTVELDVPTIHRLPFDRELQRNPGGKGGHDALAGVADSVEAFVDEVLGAVPPEAVDLRSLPPENQVRQLSTELAIADSEETVRAVVEDPTEVVDTLRADVGELLEGVDTAQGGTTGAMLELTRA